MHDKDFIKYIREIGLDPYLSIFRKKKVHEKIRIWLPKKEFKKYFGDYEKKKWVSNEIEGKKPDEWTDERFYLKVSDEIQKDIWQESKSYLYIIDAIVVSVSETRLDKINETDLVLLDIPRFNNISYTLENFKSFIKDSYTYCKNDEEGFIIVFSKNKSKVEKYFKALRRHKLI